MNERDRHGLWLLLKQRDGEWDKLRRDLVAMPQPKRGRPSSLLMSTQVFGVAASNVVAIR